MEVVDIEGLTFDDYQRDAAGLRSNRGPSLQSRTFFIRPGKKSSQSRFKEEVEKINFEERLMENDEFRAYHEAIKRRKTC